MTENNECYAYFGLAGSFDPDAITLRVGSDPTRTTREGDPIPKTKLRQKCSRWQLHSRLPRTAQLESHVSDVLDQLDAQEIAFREVSQQFGGIMGLVGYFYDYYPGLVFEREIVERLAKYGLTVDFDFYGWEREDAKPDSGQTAS
jgi:uncharacterized protein DUF4279